ncbi:superoxide dismutase [Cu-Zn] SodC [Pseudoduganella chitinolytica]|uniref:Superoxide dismutase [Cu-Zn] n=1 Tax=Pseudoduganella chitinolytica TaxID=34070 RepID=A0ABY8BDJ7_9BURK|nr:superoxide dismutase [Cu-Zn] SodC [Pseudoduganella chitinolytica]WEF32812.1 superoxide dismutase [Cu-Zn] SodC [Pseudoduganella chitinolytica]
MLTRLSFTLAALGLSAVAHAQITVPIHSVASKDGDRSLGSVTITETPGGLQFTPALQGLPPGQRGFHVHMNGNCGEGPVNGKVAPAGAAGGHLDPHGSNAHKGPGNGGHLGDLPALEVDSSGSALKPVVAPQLKTLADVKGRALMIHAGGDNYADAPAPLGGGGGRIACGVIADVATK